MDLRHLTKEERDTIMSVVKKDEQLKEDDQKIFDEMKLAIKHLQVHPARPGISKDILCQTCNKTFRVNHRSFCQRCHQKVCKNCKVEISKGGKWICVLCLKQRNLEEMSGAWILKYQKRKYTSDTDTDVDHDMQEGELQMSPVPKRMYDGIHSLSPSDEIKQLLLRYSARSKKQPKLEEPKPAAKTLSSIVKEKEQDPKVISIDKTDKVRFKHKQNKTKHEYVPMKTDVDVPHQSKSQKDNTDDEKQLEILPINSKHRKNTKEKIGKNSEIDYLEVPHEVKHHRHRKEVGNNDQLNHPDKLNHHHDKENKSHKTKQQQKYEKTEETHSNPQRLQRRTNEKSPERSIKVSNETPLSTSLQLNVFEQKQIEHKHQTEKQSNDEKLDSAVYLKRKYNTIKQEYKDTAGNVVKQHSPIDHCCEKKEEINNELIVFQGKSSAETHQRKQIKARRRPSRLSSDEAKTDTPGIIQQIKSSSFNQTDGKKKETNMSSKVEQSKQSSWDLSPKNEQSMTLNPKLLTRASLETSYSILYDIKSQSKADKTDIERDTEECLSLETNNREITPVYSKHKQHKPHKTTLGNVVNRRSKQSLKASSSYDENTKRRWLSSMGGTSSEDDLLSSTEKLLDETLHLKDINQRDWDNKKSEDVNATEETLHQVRSYLESHKIVLKQNSSTTVNENLHLNKQQGTMFEPLDSTEMAFRQLRSSMEDDLIDCKLESYSNYNEKVTVKNDDITKHVRNNLTEEKPDHLLDQGSKQTETEIISELSDMSCKLTENVIAKEASSKYNETISGTDDATIKYVSNHLTQEKTDHLLEPGKKETETEIISKMTDISENDIGKAANNKETNMLCNLSSTKDTTNTDKRESTNSKDEIRNKPSLDADELSIKASSFEIASKDNVVTEKHNISLYCDINNKTNTDEREYRKQDNLSSMYSGDNQNRESVIDMNDELVLVESHQNATENTKVIICDKNRVNSPCQKQISRQEVFAEIQENSINSSLLFEVKSGRETGSDVHPKIQENAINQIPENGSVDTPLSQTSLNVTSIPSMPIHHSSKNIYESDSSDSGSLYSSYEETHWSFGAKRNIPQENKHEKAYEQDRSKSESIDSLSNKDELKIDKKYSNEKCVTPDKQNMNIQNFSQDDKENQNDNIQQSDEVIDTLSNEDEITTIDKAFTIDEKRSQTAEKQNKIIQNFPLDNKDEPKDLIQRSDEMIDSSSIKKDIILISREFTNDENVTLTPDSKDISIQNFPPDSKDDQKNIIYQSDERQRDTNTAGSIEEIKKDEHAKSNYLIPQSSLIKSDEHVKSNSIQSGAINSKQIHCDSTSSKTALEKQVPVRYLDVKPKELSMSKITKERIVTNVKKPEEPVSRLLEPGYKIEVDPDWYPDSSQGSDNKGDLYKYYPQFPGQRNYDLKIQYDKDSHRLQVQRKDPSESNYREVSHSEIRTNIPDRTNSPQMVINESNTMNSVLLQSENFMEDSISTGQEILTENQKLSNKLSSKQEDDSVTVIRKKGPALPFLREDKKTAANNFESEVNLENNSSENKAADESSNITSKLNKPVTDIIINDIDITDPQKVKNMELNCSSRSEEDTKYEMTSSNEQNMKHEVKNDKSVELVHAGNSISSTKEQKQESVTNKSCLDSNVSTEALDTYDIIEEENDQRTKQQRGTPETGELLDNKTIMAPSPQIEKRNIQPPKTCSEGSDNTNDGNVVIETPQIEAEQKRHRPKIRNIQMAFMASKNWFKSIVKKDKMSSIQETDKEKNIEDDSGSKFKSDTSKLGDLSEENGVKKYIYKDSSFDLQSPKAKTKSYTTKHADKDVISKAEGTTMVQTSSKVLNIEDKKHLMEEEETKEENNLNVAEDRVSTNTQDKEKGEHTVGEYNVIAEVYTIDDFTQSTKIRHGVINGFDENEVNNNEKLPSDTLSTSSGHLQDSLVRGSLEMKIESDEEIIKPCPVHENGITLEPQTVADYDIIRTPMADRKDIGTPQVGGYHSHSKWSGLEGSNSSFEDVEEDIIESNNAHENGSLGSRHSSSKGSKKRSPLRATNNYYDEGNDDDYLFSFNSSMDVSIHQSYIESYYGD